MARKAHNQVAVDGWTTDAISVARIVPVPRSSAALLCCCDPPLDWRVDGASERRGGTCGVRQTSGLCSIHVLCSAAMLSTMPTSQHGGGAVVKVQRLQPAGRSGVQPTQFRTVTAANNMNQAELDNQTSSCHCQPTATCLPSPTQLNPSVLLRPVGRGAGGVRQRASRCWLCSCQLLWRPLTVAIHGRQRQRCSTLLCPRGLVICICSVRCGGPCSCGYRVSAQLGTASHCTQRSRCPRLSARLRRRAPCCTVPRARQVRTSQLPCPVPVVAACACTLVARCERLSLRRSGGATASRSSWS